MHEIYVYLCFFRFNLSLEVFGLNSIKTENFLKSTVSPHSTKTYNIKYY